jgi:hypothetical protein
MRLETRLTHALGWFQLVTQEASSINAVQVRLSFFPCYIAVCDLVGCCLFEHISDPFIMIRDKTFPSSCASGVVPYFRVSVLGHPIIPPPQYPMLCCILRQNAQLPFPMFEQVLRPQPYASSAHIPPVVLMHPHTSLVLLASAAGQGNRQARAFRLVSPVHAQAGKGPSLGAGANSGAVGWPASTRGFRQGRHAGHGLMPLLRCIGGTWRGHWCLRGMRGHVALLSGPSVVHRVAGPPSAATTAPREGTTVFERDMRPM